MGPPPDRTKRFEFAALRRTARTALVQFGVNRANLRLLRHEHNTTFRVDTGEATFVLRLNRPGVHAPDAVASELAWLRAINDESDLGAPDPVTACDGSPLVVLPPNEEGQHQTAVLLRWQDGRMVDERLTPRHLHQVAVLQAGLQTHAETWARPDCFVRPRVDTLTNAAKSCSVTAADTTSGRRPSRDDADACRALADQLLPAAEGAVLDRALDIVWATTDELATQPGSAGLIHGDLHYENLLFHRGVARAIDFDDCGWGFYLYDLAVTLWELEARARYAELRDAMLEEYSRHRSLPTDHHRHLQALFVLRRMQIVMWILESRHHAAFRDDWRLEATDELAAIGAAIERLS